MNIQMFFLLMSAIYLAPDVSKRARNILALAFIVAAVVNFGQAMWRHWV